MLIWKKNSSNSDCLFCKIVKQEIPCKKICENKYAIAFLDIDPVSDGHTLVIPKKHYNNLIECDKKSLDGVMLLCKEVIDKLNKTLKPAGYNYLSNHGKIAGQVIFHFHLHIIPKYYEDEGLICNTIKKTKKVDDIYKLLQTTI